MKAKRGQEVAGNAAGLIIFVGFILILYVLAISPKDRAELLGENVSENETLGQPTTGQILLLQESPGSVYPEQQNSFEHKLNQIVLSSQAEDTVLAEKASVYVMASKLDRKRDEIRFDVDTRTNQLNALLLSMYVKHSAGRLIVSLNGKEVFNGALEEGAAKPIHLDTKLIRSENYLRFSVPPVPWYRFWGRNEYELRGIKLIASTKNTATMQALSTFRLSQQELDEFDHGYLRFMVECSGSQQGVLKVFVNGNLLSSSIADCYGYQKIDIGREDIVKGKNQLVFELSEGTAYLTNGAVKIELKKPEWPIYYFDINQSTWERINHSRVFLELEFVKEGSSKEAKFTINQRKFFMDTKETTYKKDITGYLRENNNFISIEPESELNIASLKVYIED